MHADLEKEALFRKVNELKLELDGKSTRLEAFNKQKAEYEAQICFLQSQRMSAKKRLGVTVPVPDWETELLAKRKEYEEAFFQKEEAAKRGDWGNERNLFDNDRA